MKKRSLVLSLLAVVPLSAFSAIQPGYYVGPGDGATVVLRVLPGDKKAVLGSFNEYQGMGYKPRPITPEMVKKAGEAKGVGPNGGHPKIGDLKQIGKNKYTLTMNLPSQGLPLCISEVVVTPQGLELGKDHPAGNCIEYHGATWGYGHGMGNILKPYKVN